MEDKELKKIANFFFEIMQLKRTPRSGVTSMGIENPDSVAEHVLAAAQIAFILGKMEKANAERAALIALFHDNGEARIGDLDKRAAYYLNSKEGEEKAFKEQTQELPGGNEIIKMFQEFEEKNTPEAIIAKDADKLELIVQVKCYLDQGINKKAAKMWNHYAAKSLKTDSAKKLFEIIKETNMNEWWLSIPFIKKEIEKYGLDK